MNIQILNYIVVLYISKICFARNTCFKWPGIVVEPGTRWKERCRECVCPDTGIMSCTEPLCTTPYEPYHEYICLQWSDNNCCCEEFGCFKHGQLYKAGELYPLFVDDACIQCQCSEAWGSVNCFVIECSRPHCADYIFEKGKCCPVCPNGSNCKVPHLDIGRGLPLRNTGDVQYIKIGETKLVVLGHQRFSWSCACEVAGEDAECSRQSRLE